MAALKFPANPDVNDTYTENGYTWQWNGVAWLAVTPATAQAVLQVVHASTDTEVFISTEGYVDTTLSATITPTSSTSKILILVNQNYFMIRSANSVGCGIRILRGTTPIFTPATNSDDEPLEYFISAFGATQVNHANRASINFLDEPNTTNAVTYKTQGALWVSSSNGTLTFQGDGGTSFITLMEIAG